MHVCMYVCKICIVSSTCQFTALATVLYPLSEGCTFHIVRSQMCRSAWSTQAMRRQRSTVDSKTSFLRSGQHAVCWGLYGTKPKRAEPDAEQHFGKWKMENDHLRFLQVQRLTKDVWTKIARFLDITSSNRPIFAHASCGTIPHDAGLQRMSRYIFEMYQVGATALTNPPFRPTCPIS